MYSLGKSGGEWCHCVYLLNGNLHYFSYTQPYSYPVWNNFISTQTHTCTHWSVKEINKRHMLYVFHTHSLKHGNMKLRNSFSTTKLCPNSQVFSPSFQQYQETRSPHRKITTKQAYRTRLLPLLFVNTFKHLLTEFCLSCILISKAVCLGLLIAWGLERFPRAWGENCPPGIKEGWSL